MAMDLSLHSYASTDHFIAIPIFVVGVFRGCQDMKQESLLDVRTPRHRSAWLSTYRFGYQLMASSVLYIYTSIYLNTYIYRCICICIYYLCIYIHIDR